MKSFKDSLAGAVVADALAAEFPEAYALGLSTKPLASDASLGFIAGKSMTSLMLFVSVRSMVILSTPHPQPPVGGRPYSRAVTKLISI
jgi:hypothetical protein